MGSPNAITYDVAANIIIAYLNDDALVIRVLNQWKQENVPLYCSTVVETEVLSYPQYSLQERRTIELFLEENFISIPFDRSVARIAAHIRAHTKTKFPDAAIAATARYTSSPVVTRNVKDFRNIHDIQIIVV